MLGVTVCLAIALVFSLLGAIAMRFERDSWRNLAERYRNDFIRLANQAYPPNDQSGQLSMDPIGFDETFEEEDLGTNVVEFPKTRKGDN